MQWGQPETPVMYWGLMVRRDGTRTELEAPGYERQKAYYLEPVEWGPIPVEWGQICGWILYDDGGWLETFGEFEPKYVVAGDKLILRPEEVEGVQELLPALNYKGFNQGDTVLVKHQWSDTYPEQGTPGRIRYMRPRTNVAYVEFLLPVTLPSGITLRWDSRRPLQHTYTEAILLSCLERVP